MTAQTLLIIASFVLVGMSLLMGIMRLVIGPSVVDRIVALDAVVLCAVGFLALLSFVWRTTVYLDLLLVISLLGFLTTVAFVNYLKENGTDAQKNSAEENQSDG